MVLRTVLCPAVRHSGQFLPVKLFKTGEGKRLRLSALAYEEFDKSSSGRESRERVEAVKQLLSREWLMPQPSTQISEILISTSSSTEKVQQGRNNFSRSFEHSQYFNGKIRVSEKQQKDIPKFFVIRDDLLHPLLGGNKLRKLDALIPELERVGATDVVTCGGCQSAHTAALAYACAERGMLAHLLLRGEKPGTPTGYNLLCGMYGHVTYIPRSEYADRRAMLSKHASRIAGKTGSVAWLDEREVSVQISRSDAELEHERKRTGERNVVVVKEGAGDAIALLGLIRLVNYLSRQAVFGSSDSLHIVVDTGTGTTAVGIALGISLLGLPWKVTGVMLADSLENYEKHQVQLVSGFLDKFSIPASWNAPLPLSWEPRFSPRKFGKILPGEIVTCQSTARQTGILLDPIYTLAGWETATKLALDYQKLTTDVLMLHTGGTLGLFGLAQRYPERFN